jgi:hypothetical protein
MTAPVCILRLTWRCIDCGVVRWKMRRGRTPKRCFGCHRRQEKAYNARYYQAHREAIRARHTRWWAKNGGRYAKAARMRGEKG